MIRFPQLLLPALLLVAIAGTARADRLDEQLNKRLPDLIEQLKRKYKNVGVLRFRVQDGNRKETFDSPLSGRLVERLETMLILNNGSDESKALGILYKPGLTAARSKIATWFAPAERARLFRLDYPLYWGNRSVKADAFLTGKVTVSPDRKKTRLELQLFDRQQPEKLQELAAFDVPTPLSIVRDLGYSFKVVKRSIDEGAMEEQPNVPQLPNSDDPNPSKPQVDPANIAGIQLQVLANDESVEIRPSGAATTAFSWQMGCPKPNDKIAIRLINLTEKKLGVVLRLNGVNVLNEDRKDPESSPKIIMTPNRRQLIQGFVLFNMPEAPGARVTTTTLPFKVFVDDEAKQLSEQLGEKAGLLEVDVFEEVGKKDETNILVATRGLPPSKEKEARASYHELRSQLLKSNNLITKVVNTKGADGLVRTREIIEVDRNAQTTGPGVEVVDFKGSLRARVGIKIVKE